MSTEAIVCQNLVRHFDSTRAVDHFDLTVAHGEFMALLGASGCGKTTALRLIAGFEQAQSGSIKIAGRVVSGPNVHIPPEQRKVGMVFQEYALFPHLSVEDNVQYGLRRSGEKMRRVAKVLELVGLSGLARRMPNELSGGQQQRVALARALAPRPDVVLLDEPFSNLDAGLRVRLRSEVREILGQTGTTTVFVTHDQEEALSLADRIAVMVDGHIAQTGTPHDLYRVPATREIADFVGEANFLLGESDGEVVECALGRLPIMSTLRGTVDVLLRPEWLHVTPDPSGNAEVLVNQFFGHDRLLTVRIASDQTLNVRLGPNDNYQPGQRIALAVQEPVIVYPASDNGNS